MQHGVVVVVHPPQFGRFQAAGLPPQPAAHQRRSGRRQHQGTGAGAQQERHLPHHARVHAVDGDADRHQPGDLAAAVEDRDGRVHGLAHGRAERGGVPVPGEALGVGAGHVLADQVRVGVRPPVAGRAERDDVVDSRRPAGRLRPGLEQRARVGGTHGGERARGVREGLGTHERAGPGLGQARLLGLQGQRRHGHRTEQDHDDELQDEHLARDGAQARREAAVALGGRERLGLRGGGPHVEQAEKPLHGLFLASADVTDALDGHGTPARPTPGRAGLRSNMIKSRRGVKDGRR